MSEIENILKEMSKSLKELVDIQKQRLEIEIKEDEDIGGDISRDVLKMMEGKLGGFMQNMENVLTDDMKKSNIRMDKMMGIKEEVELESIDGIEEEKLDISDLDELV